MTVELPHNSIVANILPYLIQISFKKESIKALFTFFIPRITRFLPEVTTTLELVDVLLGHICMLEVYFIAHKALAGLRYIQQLI